MNKQLREGKEHVAVAYAKNVPISTKHSIEISNALRYQNTTYAKKFLEEVMGLKRAVPFRRATKDLGHKPGMSSGRFPQKAAREFLKLIKSAEANAQVKGLDTTNLKIAKILANKASIPMSAGRNRHASKNSHLEVMVKEFVKGRKGQEKIAKAKDTKLQAPAPVKGTEHHPVKTEVHPTVVASAPSYPPQQQEKVVPKTDSHAHQAPHPEAKRVEEPSPAALLRQAQEKAAWMKKNEGEKKDAEKVANLYEELKKKGTLRGEKK